MPAAPPWLDKIRFIANYAISSCTAPVSLYAEMAQPIAKEIALVFISGSVQDITKEFFRPKGLRSKRHGRKGRKYNIVKGGIPDANETFAKNIPGHYEVAQRSYGLPTRVLYVLSDTFDRVLWTGALLEMSLDLVYETLLGVMENGVQNCDNLGRMHRHGGYHVEGGVGPTWEAYECGPVLYRVGINSPSAALAYFDAGTYSITVGAHFTKPTGGAGTITVRMREAGGTEIFDISPTMEVGNGVNATIILNATVNGPNGVAIECNVTGGFVDTVHNDFIIMEIL